MRYQLNVYAAPWSHPAQSDALAFALAALQAGHEVARVFFFMDGVYTGLSTQAPASDDPHWLADWQSLHQRCDCELLLCIAASANRGLLNADEAERQGKAAVTVEPPFQLVGLGQWALGFGDCDRVVSFR